MLQADHDPRHPAYIAAQAPVADSTSDFWQMIWEQGTIGFMIDSVSLLMKCDPVAHFRQRRFSPTDPIKRKRRTIMSQLLARRRF